MAEATSLELPMATLACGHVNKKLGSRAAPHYNGHNDTTLDTNDTIMDTTDDTTMDTMTLQWTQ